LLAEDVLAVVANPGQLGCLRLTHLRLGFEDRLSAVAIHGNTLL